MELARFRLPSGGILELFGPKNIWHPFTAVPDWEVIIADIRHLVENSHNSGGQDQTGFTGS